MPYTIFIDLYKCVKGGVIVEKETYIIDRLEGDYVVCETYDGFMMEIKLNKIHGSFKEGDVLFKEGEFFKVSEELTKERRKRIKDIVIDMWK